uniref:Uncharacterized protein n=1 Tax=Lepeophtheirus salmonis TaxID=72036 RepID=A0A0K2UE28_LEPSM
MSQSDALTLIPNLSVMIRYTPSFVLEASLDHKNKINRTKIS